jgi:perosamine synthetase
VTLPRHADHELVDWFVYVVRLHPEIDRDGLIDQLAERGVQTRPYFAPIHLQPFYRATFGFKPGDFPVTERIAASTLALPFSSRLTDSDAAYVADALVDIVNRDGRRSKDQPGARVNPDRAHKDHRDGA